MRNKRRTAEEWRSLVTGQRTSGQRDQEYAQSVGVSLASLRSWRQKLKVQGVAEGAVKFVEVTGMAGGSTARVILPNGIRIEVTPGLSFEYLRQVVWLLRSL